MANVTVVIGAGSIGQAIARRVSAGKHVLLADLRQEKANVAAKVLSDAGFQVSTAPVDVSSRESVHSLVRTATALGDVTRTVDSSPAATSLWTVESQQPTGTANSPRNDCRAQHSGEKIEASHGWLWREAV